MGEAFIFALRLETCLTRLETRRSLSGQQSTDSHNCMPAQHPLFRDIRERQCQTQGCESDRSHLTASSMQAVEGGRVKLTLVETNVRWNQVM